MKKIKKILACVTTAVIIITAGMFGSYNAECAYDEFENAINNSEYLEYISNFEISKVEEWLKDYDTDFQTPLHVYGASRCLVYEYTYGGDPNTRHLVNGFFWGLDMPCENENDAITKEELNEFLQSEGFDATVPCVNFCTGRDGETYISTRVEIDKDTNYGYFAEVYYALCQEYGFIPDIYFEASETIFENVYTDETTLPSFNFGTPTIAGDIDLNNEQGTADIIVLSKYIANSQLYPITDPTALANADMNQDKEVNSLDANILVEMSLGDYENIVS